MPPPPHALRLDGRELVYAGFERRGDTLALVAGAEVPLDAETFQSGLLGGPAREPGAFEARVAELVAAAGGEGKAPTHASLVIPDAWLRVAFADSGELPPEGEGRDDVLRWKLKRLVPFRVEELRLSSVEVTPLPLQSTEEPHRLLLGFAVDSLLTQVEAAFDKVGVRIGRITNDSLALLAAVVGGTATDDQRLDGLVRVADSGYTLVFHRGDEPVLHRYKGFAGDLPEGSHDHLVRRDLRLTRTFLEEQLPGVPLGRVLVAAPDDVAAAWCERLAAGLDCAAEPLERHHLPPLEVAAANADWQRLGPMVGAACQEVA